jgi:hypothetical protein
MFPIMYLSVPDFALLATLVAMVAGAFFVAITGDAH